MCIYIYIIMYTYIYICIIINALIIYIYIYVHTYIHTYIHTLHTYMSIFPAQLKQPQTYTIAYMHVACKDQPQVKFVGKGGENSKTNITQPMALTILATNDMGMQTRGMAHRIETSRPHSPYRHPTLQSQIGAR